MSKIDVSKIAEAVQKLINAGEVTFMGNNLVYHSASGAFNVGDPDDIMAVWNRISAYKSRDKV